MHIFNIVILGKMNGSLSGIKLWVQYISQYTTVRYHSVDHLNPVCSGTLSIALPLRSFSTRCRWHLSQRSLWRLFVNLLIDNQLLFRHCY